ncbi:MAG: hypothetical protein MZV70_71255 [Desulfobacterales bacterium]|nr:hypothetical protein [Desulfobacterales bacterium]
MAVFFCSGTGGHAPIVVDELARPEAWHTAYCKGVCGGIARAGPQFAYFQ